jgi:hypothetical protein
LHPSERNRLHREIRRLLLAGQDMKLVAETAEMLVDDESLGGWRVLETGLVVTYARAYTLDSQRRGLPDELYPQGDDRPLHDSLMRLRGEYYAHTDETPHREAVDPFGEHRYAERYPVGLAEGVLRRLRALTSTERRPPAERAFGEAWTPCRCAPLRLRADVHPASTARSSASASRSETAC